MRPENEMAILKCGSCMKDVILRMTECGCGLGGIVNADLTILGVISDGDLRRNAENLFEKDPLEILCKEPIFVAPENLVGSAIKKMKKNKVYSILVLENERPIWIVANARFAESRICVSENK